MLLLLSCFPSFLIELGFVSSMTGKGDRMMECDYKVEVRKHDTTTINDLKRDRRLGETVDDYIKRMNDGGLFERANFE